MDRTTRATYRPRRNGNGLQSGGNGVSTAVVQDWVSALPDTAGEGNDGTQSWGDVSRDEL